MKRTLRKPRAERPLRVGDLVEVRPLSEIVQTLDDSGRLDGMPFMPEMAAYCGQRATVSKRAHKTCDGRGNLRWLDDTVHLADWRCDGSAHDGCQARCLQFWKTAWLRVVDQRDADATTTERSDEVETAELLSRLGPVSITGPGGAVRFTCQATEVVSATRPLPARELKQYIWDVTSGNWPLWKICRVLCRSVANIYQRWSVEHLPRAILIRGGRIPEAPVEGRCEGLTPKRILDLRVGETVRVRALPEIEETLNEKNTNRGLMFDREMATWCGTSGQVIDRVQRIIDENSGEKIELKSDCIIVKDKACRGEYFKLCSRGLYPFWREAWLERDNASNAATAE